MDHILRRNAAAGIPHGNMDIVIILMGADAHGASLSGIAHCIVQKDHQNLFDPIRVRDHVGQFFVHVKLQANAFLLDILPIALTNVVDQFPDVEGGFFHILRA